MDAKHLRDVGDNLFSKKSPLTSLHQEIADNFYPERADFTVRRPLGTDFAAQIMSSYPVRCRRDLGNQFGTMLRPTAKQWFHTARRHVKEEDNDTREFLQHIDETMRRAMYDQKALFTRAKKEADHDFAAFGQSVVSIQKNKVGDGLLYRCWHLRDMAWAENEEGKIGSVFRRWKPSAWVLSRLFPNTVHESVRRMADKDPFEEVEVMHMVVEADMYDKAAGGRPYWSIWYDTQHGAVLEETPMWNQIYVIPRWQTVSGSQYSFSPATVAALPDARLLQAMTFTLLEAGEKATSPPMVATADAVRTDVDVAAGGITWVDREYDERLGEALRPIQQDFRGFNFGVELSQDTRQMILQAFYLDRLNMPERAPEMTAYEVGQRVQEWIRNALPIFEPMEMEDSAATCELTFSIMFRAGAFGSPLDWPRKLRGVELEWRFESPLHDAIEQQKGQTFLQAKGLIAEAMALDPAVSALPKAEVALRDALNGIGVPATWLNSEQQVADAKKQAQIQQQAQQTLANMNVGSQVANNLGQAQKATAQAQTASGGGGGGGGPIQLPQAA